MPLINSLVDQNKHMSSPCWILTTKLPIRRGDEIVGTAGISRNIHGAEGVESGFDSTPSGFRLAHD